VYLLDFDSTTRTETVQFTDAVTGTVLDTRSVSNFHTGQYWIWTVSGHVRIAITLTSSSPNAVLSALFFDP
jgi:hypothetical protein